MSAMKIYAPSFVTAAWTALAAIGSAIPPSAGLIVLGGAVAISVRETMRRYGSHTR